MDWKQKKKKHIVIGIVSKVEKIQSGKIHVCSLSKIQRILRAYKCFLINYTPNCSFCASSSFDFITIVYKIVACILAQSSHLNCLISFLLRVYVCVCAVSRAWFLLIFNTYFNISVNKLQNWNVDPAIARH